MRAFSLIELIFVIVIMGVLTFTGLQFIPDEKLTVYTQMLKAKILEKKSNALGYRYTGDNNLTCITFNKDWLTLDENNSKVKYDFNKTYISISIEPDLNENRLCFDYLGRDYNGSVDENLTNLIHNEVNITLTYRNNEQNIITVYPISGAVK
jgi:prepilin-type N-terminal cleavage/methylation domain-containing protein